MLEELFGLPAHVLVVHGTVVFVPLQIAAALAYAFIPIVRRRVAWLVIGLAVVGPISAAMAKLSGDAFRDRRAEQGVGGELLTRIDQHGTYGLRTAIASVVLSLLTAALVLVQVSRSRRGRGGAAAGGSAEGGTSDGAPQPRRAGWSAVVVAAVLTVAVVVAGASAGYFVVRTGHTGSEMVWEDA